MKWSGHQCPVRVPMPVPEARPQTIVESRREARLVLLEWCCGVRENCKLAWSDIVDGPLCGALAK